MRFATHTPPLNTQVVNATWIFNQLLVRDTTATAALELTNIHRIVIGRNAISSNNSIDGLLDNQSCAAYLGSTSIPFDVRISNASNSSLLVECPQASELLLDNQGGRCLAAIMPDATNITVAGNGTVAVVLNANLTMPNVDVSNMTAGSHLQLYITNGTAVAASLGSIQGTLPYRLQDAECAVVITGCKPQRMPCKAVDAAGRDACCYDRTSTCETTLARDSLCFSA